VRGAAFALSLLAAGAVALGLVLSGGGKPPLSKAEYSRTVTASLTRLAADFRGAGEQAQASAGLRRMKAALDRAAVRLGKVSAPRDAAPAHRALVAELQDYAAQVDLVRASVDFGDPGTILVHLREVTAPAQINRTLDTLVAKGYDIPVRIARVRR
jgi:hypothetical protein